MPKYNFSFKIIAGKQTGTKVELYPTSVNEKTVCFKNGKQVKLSELTLELQELIQNKLNKYHE